MEGREGLGRLREGACNKVSRRTVKAFRTSLGDVRGPVGVSLAASYSGLASRAKLGTQRLKNPTSPKKENLITCCWWLEITEELSVVCCKAARGRGERETYVGDLLA